MSPAVACIPAGGWSRRVSSLAPSSGAQVSFQGEAGVRPGTVVLSNPAVRQDYAVGPGRGEPGGVQRPAGLLRERLCSRSVPPVVGRL